MALTQNEIDLIIDPALDRIGAGPAAYSPQTDTTTLAVLRHYERTRDSLLRSWLWPWATDRAALVKIQTLTVDLTPAPAAWSVGDVLVGASSGTTCTVLVVNSVTEYVVAYLDGDFTDSEVIADDGSVNSIDCADDYPTVADTAPATVVDFALQYELPTDFVRLESIFELDDSDYRDDRFKREGNRILTNYTTLEISYVKKITDPTRFEDLLAELFILKLA